MLEALVWLGAVSCVLWVFRALLVVATANSDIVFNVDASCKKTSFSCGVMGGIVMTVLTLALGGAIFLFYRLRRVRGPYVRQAKKNPADLVQTAGSVIGDVVGRDELCHVIMDDLRDRGARRPHIIIGGVGTGKTAVLVQLTQVLAQNGAVPVAIRLRDVQTELDFRALARKRFLARVESALGSSAEGEKIWRKLCKNDQIVVLADGLEEAFAGTDSEPDRDNLIRLAITEARVQSLPLVIASRPHDPLKGMNAAMLDLEPLSEEAALEYLQGTMSGLDERLEWLVETAAVVEAPLYLQIAKELHGKALLRYTHPGRRTDQLDTRGVDRVALRLRLIDTWAQALVRGHFRTELALSGPDRQAALEQLSALACIGLKNDSLHVRFNELEGFPRATPASAPSQADQSIGAPGTAKDGSSAPRDATQNPDQPPLESELARRLRSIGQSQYVASNPRLNCGLAATNGMHLGLVEPYRDGVRFQHSIMQAYLGSRYIEAVATDDAFMQDALADPGRELLMALVLYSRSRSPKVSEERDDEPAVALRPIVTYEPPHAITLRDLLRTAADKAPRNAKTLDMLASALEIDVVVGKSIHTELAEDLAKLWKEISSNDRTVEEVKLRAVARLGESARAIALRRMDGEARLEPAYKQLFDIGRFDESYRVRVAAAQEIGAGGDIAFDALRDNLGPTEFVQSSSLTTNEAAPHHDTQNPGAPRNGLNSLAREHKRCEQTMRAWLAPMLVGSVDKCVEYASANLDLWLRHVGSHERASDRVIPLAVEVALAQGFKYAANRRPEHPVVRSEARNDLSERAGEMLAKETFWFSRLTLVHALCLWALPETPAHNVKPRRRRSEAPVSDPEALVDRWLWLPDGEGEHPFVTEARDLAVLALQSGQPERFIWIDESGVVMKVGTHTHTRPGVRRRQHLWVSASTGWSTLHPRAQQLVGDVLLLLNLAERGRDPNDRDRRLSRARRNDLPPCLTHDRSRLNPTNTVGAVKTSAPGSNCKHGCKFDLCPYPPKGEQAYRSELSEAFCRRQQTLLWAGWLHRPAPWQRVLPMELKSFWSEMEERARR